MPMTSSADVAFAASAARHPPIEMVVNVRGAAIAAPGFLHVSDSDVDDVPTAMRPRWPSSSRLPIHRRVRLSCSGEAKSISLVPSTWAAALCAAPGERNHTTPLSTPSVSTAICRTGVDGSGVAGQDEKSSGRLAGDPGKITSYQSVMCASDVWPWVEPAGSMSGASLTVDGAPLAFPSCGVTVSVSPAPNWGPGVYTTRNIPGPTCLTGPTVPLEPPVTLTDTVSPSASCV